MLSYFRDVNDWRSKNIHMSGIERSKLSFRPSTLNKYTVFALIWTHPADEFSGCGEADVEQEDSPDWKPQSPKEMGLG